MAPRRPYTLNVSPRALAQIEAIRAYLAERNPDAASRVVDSIRKGFERLSQRPFIGRPGTAPKTHEWSGTRYPYVIVYYVTEKTELLEIAGVFHTAQGERKL